MKTTLTPTLALSTLMLAVSGNAIAQSSVTLYGLVDLNVTHYSAGGKSGAGDVTAMNDGTLNGMNGSRWGMRTTEDLGGGLYASALLEAGFLADSGVAAQGGRAFGRQIYAGLGSATYGEVRLGRQYILSDFVVSKSNPFGNALVLNPTTAVTDVGKNLPLFLNAPRADNVIQYQSPALSGFTLAAQYAPGETVADNFFGTRLVYAAGPLFAGITYEWNTPRPGSVNNKDTNKSLSASVNYDFGAFKLMGGVQNNTDLATGSGNGAAVGVSNLTVTGPTTFVANEINGYTFGIEAPIGAWKLGANYTAMTYEGATGASANLGKIGLGAAYNLSKRTLLYTSVSFATGDLKDYISQQTVLQAGLRTSF